MEDIVSKLKFTIKEIKKLDYFNEYSFQKTVGLDQVEDYEKQFEISLPSDFKAIVTGVANGLTTSLNIGIDIIDFNNFFFLDTHNYNPKYPFPFSEDIDDIQIDKLNIYDESTCGYIIVQSEGCNHYKLLVVNGKKKGTIWQHEYGYFQCISENKNISFSEWYLSYLEYELNKLKSIGYLKKEKLSSDSYLKITVKIDNSGNLRIDNLSDIEKKFENSCKDYLTDICIMVESRYIQKLKNVIGIQENQRLIQYLESNFYDMEGISMFKEFMREKDIKFIET